MSVRPSSDPDGAPRPDVLAQTIPQPRPWVILVVDDEADILESFRRLLEQAIPGIKVITTQSGRQGLEVLERERVDLVMSDFKMPGMDGIEFLVQARRLRPGIPRIMFTAFADDTLARRAITEAIVSEFMAKTATPQEMVAHVAAMLHYEPGDADGAAVAG